MSEVLIVAEHVDSHVSKPALELLTLARRIGEPVAVVFGDTSETIAKELGVSAIRFDRSHQHGNRSGRRCCGSENSRYHERRRCKDRLQRPLHLSRSAQRRQNRCCRVCEKRRLHGSSSQSDHQLPQLRKSAQACCVLPALAGNQGHGRSVHCSLHPCHGG